jgi:hypothetical protein
MDLFLPGISILGFPVRSRHICLKIPPTLSPLVGRQSAMPSPRTDGNLFRENAAAKVGL